MRWEQLSFDFLHEKLACLGPSCFPLSVSWAIDGIATGFDLTDNDSTLGRAEQTEKPGP